MRLLKRSEIIELWNNQSKEMKESFCCPNCRDILHEYPISKELNMFHCPSCNDLYQHLRDNEFIPSDSKGNLI